MMGRDWVAATRVHLFVQPGVPPLLFVSEGRWGPAVGHLPQGWECEDWEGGKGRAPRPHARRRSVQCTLPFTRLGHIVPLVGRYGVYSGVPPAGGFHVRLRRAGVEGLRRLGPEPGPGLCRSLSVFFLLLALESICLLPSGALLRSWVAAFLHTRKAGRGRPYWASRLAAGQAGQST